MTAQNPIEIWAAQYRAFREEFGSFERDWNELQNRHEQNLQSLNATRDRKLAGVDGQLRSNIEQTTAEVKKGVAAAEQSFIQKLSSLTSGESRPEAAFLDEEELLFTLKVRRDEEMRRLGFLKEEQKARIIATTKEKLNQTDWQVQDLRAQILGMEQPENFFQKLLSIIGLWSPPDTSFLRSALQQAEAERRQLMQAQEEAFRELDHQSATEQSNLLKWHRDAVDNVALSGIEAMLTIDAEFARMHEERESASREFQQEKEKETQRIQQKAEEKLREEKQLADLNRQDIRAEMERQVNLLVQQHREQEEALKSKFEQAYQAVKNAEPALEQVFATALPGAPIWDSLSDTSVWGGTTSHFYLGTLTDTLQVKGFSKSVELKCCLPLFAPGGGQPNLVILYDDPTKAQAIALMNSLTGRALVSLPGSELNVVIGAYSPREIAAPLWQLETGSRKFMPSEEYPEKDKFRTLLAELERDTHIKGSHIQMKNVSNLFELNEELGKKGETLRFNLLLIYNLLLQEYFPHAGTLVNLMTTGPECGNSCIIGIHMDDLARHLAESHNKQLWENFERGIGQTAQVLDLRDPAAVAPPDLRLSVRSKIRLESSAGTHLQKAVDFVVTLQKKKDKKILPLSEFIPKRENWWQEKAVSGISIPFGRQKLIGKEVNLEFSDQQREFGAPHGLVAGAAGTGKSNFLGVLILNACLRYSPDELKLILIDIKGTEFSPFIHTLPHVELVTTDGDRELVKTIIEKVKDKASERRKVYEQAHVGEYAAYREKCPDEKFPRYLIIIDETSALFTGEYDDPIRALLTAGVQEYRKFGIHFFFASQRFNKNFSSDLLAQCGLRISFSADDETIAFIAPSPGHVSKLRGQKNESGHGAMLPKGHDPIPFLAYARSLDADGKGQDHVKSILSDLSAFAAERHYEFEQTVYLGSQKAAFAKPENYDLLKNAHGDWPAVLFGEPIGRRTRDLSDRLSNAAGNVFVGGGKEPAAARIIVGLMYSLLAQTKSRPLKIVLFNFFIESKEPQSGWQILQQHLSVFPDRLEIVSDINQCAAFLEKTLEKIQNPEEEGLSNELTVLCFAGTENMHQVFGKVNEATNPRAKMLRKITEDGPTKGIFTIYQVLNANGYTKFFGYKLNSGTFASAYFLQCCTHRIILQTSVDDSREWLENNKEAALLGSTTEIVDEAILEVNQSKAIYFNLNDNNLSKIKTYGDLPLPDDFKQFFSL